MAIHLLIVDEKAYHNSITTLLGALEREGLLGRCDLRLVPPVKLAGVYGAAARARARHIVAFSLASRHVSRFVTWVAELRALRRPGDLIVAGGPHPTAADAAALSLGADVVFRGEADRSFPQFVRAVLEDRNWRGVPGLSFLEGASPVRTPAPEPVALDLVRSTCGHARRWAPLEITRGCPHVCGFCQTPRLWGRSPRHRSRQSVLEEIGRYRSFVRLLAPNAFGYQAERPGEPNERAIVGLLEAIRTRYPGLRVNFGVFPSEVRPEYVRRELVRAIRPLVANRYLAVGAQSGSDRVLARARRGHTVRDVLLAVETILGEGMKVLVDILFGLPGETREDARQTYDLMARIEAWGGRFRVHRFTPLPGTDFADAPARNRLDRETRQFLVDMNKRNEIQGDWEPG